MGLGHCSEVDREALTWSVERLSVATYALACCACLLGVTSRSKCLSSVARSLCMVMRSLSPGGALYRPSSS